MLAETNKYYDVNDLRCRHDFSAHREHVFRSMTPFIDAARRVAADTCQLAVVFVATLVLVDVSGTLVWICLHRSVLVRLSVFDDCCWLLLVRPPSATVVSAEPFSHGTGTLRCLQKEMATYRH